MYRPRKSLEISSRGTGGRGGEANNNNDKILKTRFFHLYTFLFFSSSTRFCSLLRTARTRRALSTLYTAYASPVGLGTTLPARTYVVPTRYNNIRFLFPGLPTYLPIYLPARPRNDTSFAAVASYTAVAQSFRPSTSVARHKCCSWCP